MGVDTFNEKHFDREYFRGTSLEANGESTEKSVIPECDKVPEGAMGMIEVLGKLSQTISNVVVSYKSHIGETMK